MERIHVTSRCLLFFQPSACELLDDWLKLNILTTVKERDLPTCHLRFLLYLVLFQAFFQFVAGFLSCLATIHGQEGEHVPEPGMATHESTEATAMAEAPPRKHTVHHAAWLRGTLHPMFMQKQVR